MNLRELLRLRTLDAPANPLPMANPTETAAALDAWIPAPEHPEIWAAFTAIGTSSGVMDHTAAAPFVPATPEGELP